MMKKQLAGAQKAFDKQMEQDGWAGDLADGISVLWGSDNRASKVRKDLTAYNKNIAELQKAAQKGETQFNAKFKQIYGKDYNQKAMADYFKNPTEQNYKKAFGDKNNIQQRVADYNQSQQTGAMAVKTTTKVAAGVAVGVATGGAGFVAMGAAAVGTAAASVAIEETDRMNLTKAVTEGKVEFREGTDHGQILKDAAWDGASVLAGGAVAKAAGTVIKGTTKAAGIARAATNTAGDVTMGAAQEYAETGEVSASGTIMNAALGSVGIAAETGAFKKVKNFVTGKKTSTPDISAATTPKAETSIPSTKVPPSQIPSQNTTLSDTELPIAGGLFGGSNKPSGSMFNKFKAKLGLSEKIEPDIKAKLKANYMKDLVETIEANDNLVVSTRIKDAVNGKPAVTELGSNINLSKISDHVANGEVCSVGTGKNQKLYINNNGTAIELKISKEKFEELFPPLETANFSQPGGTQVCTILSKINTMLDTPTGRTKLYTMLEQDGNDIIVNLNSGAPIRFTGGKPANINMKDNGINLISGNAPGIEMLEQAVLVQRIRVADKTPGSVNNIEDLSPSRLVKEARKQDIDATASLPLLGKSATSESKPEKITQIFENNYKPGEDMMTALWGGHARSVVNYDPVSKTVTYHDPMQAGYDIQESLETFLSHSKEGLSVNLNKANSISLSITRSTPEPHPTGQNIQSKPTNIIKDKYREVAQTADGSPINAMISGDNFVIQKNGKVTEIPLSEIRENGTLPIHETSTDSFIIVKAGKYGTYSVHTSNSPEIDTGLNNSSSQISAQSNKTQPPKQTLSIPAGFKENGKLLGKRSIVDANGVVMIEKNGAWKQIN